MNNDGWDISLQHVRQPDQRAALAVATCSAGPVKITRVCYCCSKCGVVIAYEEQPCPLCASRQEALEMRAINLRLHETIHAYEDQWVDEHV